VLAAPLASGRRSVVVECRMGARRAAWQGVGAVFRDGSGGDRPPLLYSLQQHQVSIEWRFWGLGGSSGGRQVWPHPIRLGSGRPCLTLSG
jgi:hypothetical protein